MPLDYLIHPAGSWFLPVIMGAALADSINPCAFSILFLSITFLFSLGKDRRYILSAGGLYILGIAFVYTLIGVGMLKVLSIFSVPNILGKIGALVLVGYSLVSILGELLPDFPLKLKIPTESHPTIARMIHKGTKPAALALGVLVGLFEFPCTGGPYLFVLSLLHDKATFWSGFCYLILYNIIFVLPLVIILMVSTTKTILEKADRIRKIKSKKGRIILDTILFLVGLTLFITL